MVGRKERGNNMSGVYDYNTGLQVESNANKAATTDFFKTKVTGPSTQIANTWSTASSRMALQGWT